MKRAWTVALCLVLAGLLGGSFLSFNGLRNEALAVFAAEVAPEINRMLDLAHSMMREFERYAPDTQEFRDIAAGMAMDISRTEAELARMGAVAAGPAGLLHHARAMERATARFALSEESARRLRNFRYDLEEAHDILRASRYNAMAGAFNEATRQGLGFLYAPLGNDLPVFE